MPKLLRSLCLAAAFLLLFFSPVFSQPENPELYSLPVHTVKDPAKVYLNGRYQGQTPLKLQLLPGLYRLTVEKTGEIPIERELYIPQDIKNFYEDLTFAPKKKSLYYVEREPAEQALTSLQELGVDFLTSAPPPEKTAPVKSEYHPLIYFLVTSLAVLILLGYWLFYYLRQDKLMAKVEAEQEAVQTKERKLQLHETLELLDKLKLEIKPQDLETEAPPPPPGPESLSLKEPLAKLLKIEEEESFELPGEAPSPSPPKSLLKKYQQELLIKQKGLKLMRENLLKQTEYLQSARSSNLLNQTEDNRKTLQLLAKELETAGSLTNELLETKLFSLEIKPKASQPEEFYQSRLQKWEQKREKGLKKLIKILDKIKAPEWIKKMENSRASDLKQFTVDWQWLCRKTRLSAENALKEQKLEDSQL